MIYIKNLSLKFEKEILYNSLNLHIKKGEKYTIIGPSGCGKTTLLNILLGFAPSFSGNITINNHKLNATNIHKIRKLFAFLPQELVFNHELAYDMFMYPFTFGYNKMAIPCQNTITNQLNTFNLDKSILQKPAHVLSGGQKQRLLLSATLLLPRKIILLDEPTASLDKENKTIVMNNLLKNNKTIICTTHDETLINTLSNTIQLKKETI